jgi:hypothetical protein
MPTSVRTPTANQLALAFPGESAWCQRWKHRAPTWRPTREGGFAPDLYRVIQIPEAPAKRFTQDHHYSGTWPAVRLAFGLQRRDLPPAPGDPDGGRLVGVIALGIPMNKAVLKVFPDLIAPYRESLELSRLVLLDECPSNAESWACSRAFQLAARLGVRGIVAHADPHPRTRLTQAGTVLLTPGHVGHVYGAAQGFAYLGRTRPRTLTVLPDATVLSDRASSKVVHTESGHRSVEMKLVALGATDRRPEQSGAAWLAQALEEVGASRLHHAGNHRFARTIGPHRTRVRLNATTLPAPRRAEANLSA